MASKSKDVFGQNTATFGGSFSADDAIMSFSQLKGADGTALGATIPLLLQNMQMNYQQAITRLFNLASNAIYLVRGRSAGNANLSQVLGPAKISAEFLNTYGNVCNAKTNSFNVTILDNCTTDGEGNFASDDYPGFTASYCVIESMGLTVAAEQMVIQQNVGMSISALEYTS